WHDSRDKAADAEREAIRAEGPIWNKHHVFRNTDATHENPKHARIPSDSEWVPFLDAAKTMRPKGRSPRTAVVREFIRWYLRRPGAKLPDRPPAGPWSTPPAAEQQAGQS